MIRVLEKKDEYREWWLDLATVSIKTEPTSNRRWSLERSVCSATMSNTTSDGLFGGPWDSNSGNIDSYHTIVFFPQPDSLIALSAYFRPDTREIARLLDHTIQFGYFGAFGKMLNQLRVGFNAIREDLEVTEQKISYFMAAHATFN